MLLTGILHDKLQLTFFEFFFLALWVHGVSLGQHVVELVLGPDRKLVNFNLLLQVGHP